MGKRRVCMDCVIAWLMFGDGAECLAGHGLVYWAGEEETDA